MPEEHKPRGEPIAPAAAPLTEERLAALRALIPEAFSEGAIDWDRLRAALGEAIDNGPERYTFSWAGKRAAMRSLQAPPAGSLSPTPAESTNFDSTRHVFIEADNLEALKLLYKAYFGRVKMIYIDPPYNTGNDFVYPDDYADPLDTYLKISGQRDSAGNLLTSNPETSGRYHSAWLSMMYPRLVLARELLRDDGVIFVSIDDHEVHNLRMLMNEVFGEETFVATLIWQKMDSPSRNDVDRAVSDYHDYIIIYAKDRSKQGLQQMAKPEILAAYPTTLPDGRLARRRQLRKNGKGARRQDRPTMWYGLTSPDGSTVYPIAPEGWEGRWVLSENTWKDRERKGLTEWIKREAGWVPYYIEVAPKQPRVPWPTLWTAVDQNRQAKAEFTSLMGSSADFESPKPSNLIEDILRLSNTADHICLDFFAGSCTTAQAVLELNRADGGNRRFIMVQLPEPTGRTDYPTIAEIGKERIRRVIARMRKENEGKLDLQTRDQPEDLGFRVFKLGPSAFRAWAGVETATPEGYVQQLGLSMEQVDAGRSAQDILWEAALREGYSLDARVRPLPGLAANTVYQVSDLDREQSFLICLDQTLHAATLVALPLHKEQVFICRDAALDDSLAANLALQCRLKTI